MGSAEDDLLVMDRRPADLLVAGPGEDQPVTGTGPPTIIARQGGSDGQDRPAHKPPAEQRIGTEPSCQR